MECRETTLADAGNFGFLRSDSSARRLKRVGANLLAGRAPSLRLLPLTLEEYNEDLRESGRLGTLQGVITENEAPEQSLRSRSESIADYIPISRRYAYCLETSRIARLNYKAVVHNTKTL